MSALVWTLVWVLALGVGAGVVGRARGSERRWMTVTVLTLALLAVVALAMGAQGGAQQVVPGALAVDVLAMSVAPAMLLGALALVLVAGRREAASAEAAWLLGTLALESLALLTTSPGPVMLIEAAAWALLAEHARRRQQRARALYLGAATVALLLARGMMAAQDEAITPTIAGLACGAALLRLGVFPLSTGLVAGLSKRVGMATIVAALPLGGVPVLLHVSHAAPQDVAWLLPALLVSAPVAAALALSRRELGRALGYTLAAAHALIAIGVLGVQDNPLSGQLLWAGALLAAAGLCAASVSVTLRLGEVRLDTHHGLHTSAPMLSAAFLMLGLGMAGMPGSLTFIAQELLLSSDTIGGWGAVAIVCALAMLNVNMLRLHFRVFLGRHAIDTPSLRIKPRERLGLLLVVGVMLGVGVAPTLLPLLRAQPAHTRTAKSAHEVQIPHTPTPGAP